MSLFPSQRFGGGTTHPIITPGGVVLSSLPLNEMCKVTEIVLCFKLNEPYNDCV